jgi:hypothetical protein
VRSDCVLLSGGLRLEFDPLVHLKEGDSVRVEKQSDFDPWKINAVNTMVHYFLLFYGYVLNYHLSMTACIFF